MEYRSLILMNLIKLEINKHDLELVSKLIYETDKNLFKKFLDKNHKTAIEKLKKLIIEGKNSYGHENIYIAENENNGLIGVIVAFRGDEITFVNEIKVYWNCMNFRDFVKLTLIKPLYDKISASSIERDDFYIGNLAVINSMRGKGIGTKILNQIITVATEKECKRVILDVIQDNIKAKKFYEKIGFKVCGEKGFKWIGLTDRTYGMEFVIDNK